MLGPDVRVIELPRLAHRQLEHLLGARCIWKIGTGRRRRFPLLDRLLDLLLNLFEIDVEIGQDRRGNALALADQAEQDVLGPDVLVMQTRRLFTGHLQNFPNAIREIVAVHLVELTFRPSTGFRFEQASYKRHVLSSTSSGAVLNSTSRACSSYSTTWRTIFPR